jgi:tRNA A37 threonylcarbamoyladenosine synthetase subunit TsaC/SUA5/YrdC
MAFAYVMSMFVTIHPDNPDARKIAQAAEILRNDGIIIYPTDTIYSIGCDLNSKKGIERIIRLKGIKPKEAHFSIICSDLAHISEYCNNFSRSVFNNKNIPRLYGFNKNTIGIRVPDNNIARDLVRELGNPIIATSVHNDGDDILEYLTDPWEINERYGEQVDMVIDGGYGSNEASTVIDATGQEPVLIRQGKGEMNVAEEY